MKTAGVAARTFVNDFFGMVEKVPGGRGERLVDALTAAFDAWGAELVEACEKAAKPNCAERCGHGECWGARQAAARVRSLSAPGR